MKILILDPSEHRRAELLSLLEAALLQAAMDTRFVCHRPGEIFTLPLPPDTDLAFMTVNCMSDVEAARQFKRLYRGVPLVVVSDSGEYAVESYTLPAASYITRPLRRTAVASALAAV